MTSEFWNESIADCDKWIRWMIASVRKHAAINDPDNLIPGTKERIRNLWALRREAQERKAQS